MSCTQFHHLHHQAKNLKSVSEWLMTVLHSKISSGGPTVLMNKSTSGIEYVVRAFCCNVKHSPYKIRMHPPQLQLAEVYLHCTSLTVFYNLLPSKNPILFFDLIKSLKISYTSVLMAYCRKRRNYNDLLFLSFIELSSGCWFWFWFFVF